MPRQLLLAFFSAVLLACGPAETPAANTTTTQLTTTTTTRPITTTTRALTTTTPAHLSPVNGLAVADPSLLDRRVVAVKIDNAPSARPQSGLQEADAVIELLVESGVTRFIALFHDADSAFLGPLRSGRPTDPTLLRPLGATFAISGAQPWVLAAIRRADVPLIGEVRPATFRIRSRRAPHNLYADTNLLRQLANDRDYPDQPPPQLFSFGELPNRSTVATEITIDFSDGTHVTWRYNGARYQRKLNGTPSTWLEPDGSEGPVTVDTLVVLFGRKYTAFPPNGDGSAVPAMEMVGSGRAIVFAGGHARDGVWSRSAMDEWFTFNDPDGDALDIPPGVPWISIVPDNRSVGW